jgi:hypothetical protein
VAIDIARMRSRVEPARSRASGVRAGENSEGQCVVNPLCRVRRTGKSIKSRTHKFPTQVSACRIPLGEKNDEGLNPHKAPRLLMTSVVRAVEWEYQLDSGVRMSLWLRTRDGHVRWVGLRDVNSLVRFTSNPMLGWPRRFGFGPRTRKLST